MTPRLTADRPLHILSLGAGVQSSTLALMAAAGEVTPMPDAAIFADTQWEPAAVYAHLDRLSAALPFPVYRVSVGHLRADAIRGVNATGHSYVTVPWFTRNLDGSVGMGRRQCTNEYKLKPLHRKVRALLGGTPKGGAVVWIGITTDEAQRMKDSRVQYIQHRWPLIERGLTRYDCQQWLALAGWTAPRSACIGCPFRSDAEWRSLTPQEFADAAEADRLIRQLVRGPVVAQYMHASRQPLDTVDFSTLEDHGQQRLWGDECSGLCGV